jgi:hypothetical protein
VIVWNAERRQAVIDLLALPDEAALHHRGYHLTIEGRADRHQILGALAARFVQFHLIEQDEREAESESSARVCRMEIQRQDYASEPFVNNASS